MFETLQKKALTPPLTGSSLTRLSSNERELLYKQLGPNENGVTSGVERRRAEDERAREESDRAIREAERKTAEIETRIKEEGASKVVSKVPKNIGIHQRAELIGSEVRTEVNEQLGIAGVEEPTRGRIETVAVQDAMHRSTALVGSGSRSVTAPDLDQKDKIAQPTEQSIGNKIPLANKGPLANKIGDAQELTEKEALLSSNKDMQANSVADKVQIPNKYRKPVGASTEIEEEPLTLAQRARLAGMETGRQRKTAA